VFNQFGALLPVNFNIEFKLFVGQSGFGALVVTFPHAPIPYKHADGTVWMRSEPHRATWPFESVVRNLPDIPYEGRAYV
jgi:hypothetical protein